MGLSGAGWLRIFWVFTVVDLRIVLGAIVAAVVVLAGRRGRYSALAAVLQVGVGVGAGATDVVEHTAKLRSGELFELVLHAVLCVVVALQAGCKAREGAL